jgi:hypothetical protein
MQRLRAANLDSARDFYAGLADFQTELEHAETGTFLVTGTFSGSNREILAVLRALEKCVSQRCDGAAVVGLDGRDYTLHPTDPPEPEEAVPVRRRHPAARVGQCYGMAAFS